VGDCTGSGQVTVNDVILMTNIALGTAELSACTAGDQNNDGKITINEIVTAVDNALHGCMPALTSSAALDNLTPLNGAWSVCPAEWSVAPGRDPLQMTLAGFEAAASNRQADSGFKWNAVGSPLQFSWDRG
jgi:hypothetical protein